MEKREKILTLTSWISIIGNSLLSIAKIVVGLFFGSLAVLGDGIDSATDVIISFVTLFTAKIISRPPSPKYVYGYEKADSIATKVLSMVIFFAGTQMLVSTIKSIFSSDTRELPSTITIYVTVISMIGKFLLAYYMSVQGKRANSSMLIANGKNMRNDVIISAGVLLGLVFTFILKMPILDSITGFLISIYIIKSSISIFMESSTALMDGVKDMSIYTSIFEAVKKVSGASNPHRVRSRQIGNLYMIALDIEVDDTLSLLEAHQLAHDVEDSIRNTVENVYDIVVHVEPKGCSHSNEGFGLNKDMF